MNRGWRYFTTLCVLMALMSPVYADNAAPIPSNLNQERSVLSGDEVPVAEITSPQLVKAENTDLQNLERLWAQLEARKEERDLVTVSAIIEQIFLMRDGLGIRDLPRYALQLLDQADTLLQHNQRDEARLFYRWGYKLAPNSPEILWRVLPVASEFGITSSLYVLKRALAETVFSPFRLLSLLQATIYPLLLSLSVALAVSLVLIFCVNVMEIFRVLAWRIKPEKRGWLIPAVFLAMVVLPLFVGFLWCIALWSICLYVLLPEKRFLSVAAGTVIMAWGVLVPLRENIASWLADAQVSRVVIDGEQPLAVEEAAGLRAMMNEWKGDIVIQFKYAQLLRRAGIHEEANRMLDRLEIDLGERAWLLGERAVLRYLAHDQTAAEKLLRRALELDGDSPEILFNLSKVVFEKNDTKESRELFGRALKMDKSRVESMRVREDTLGIHDPRSFADVELPFSQYFSAALVPNAESFRLAHEEIGRRMWGMDPRSAAIAGLVLLLLHLIPHQRSRRINPKGLFDEYGDGRASTAVVTLVPGGVAIVGAHIRVGFSVLTVMIFSALPLIFHAYDHGQVLARMNWFMPYHAGILLVTYLALLLFSIERRGH